MFPTPKVVLMDLCGTLLDSISHDRKVMDEIGMIYAGKTYAELRHLKDPTRSMRYNFKHFFGDLAEEAHELYIEQLIDKIPQTNLFPNSRQFLNNTKNAGIEIALISNRPASYIEAALDIHQIRGFVKRGLSAVNDLTVEKPDGGVVDQVLTLLGCAHLNKRDVAFIGDTIVDVQCADNAGCIPLVYTGNTSRHELSLIDARTKDWSKQKIFLFGDYSDLTRQFSGATPSNTHQVSTPKGPQ